MSEQSQFDLSLSPGHLLHRAQQFAADRFREASGGAEITQRQFAVLTAVNEDEGLTQTRLVKKTGIDRSTLAELVSRMASKGLLVRERAPGDARANAVRLSEAGRALYRDALKGAKAADAAILEALPKGKRANFIVSLTRIARRMELDEAELKAEAKRTRQAIRTKAEPEKNKQGKKKKKA